MTDFTPLIERLENATKPDRLLDANIHWTMNPQAFDADAYGDDEHLKPSYCYARSGWALNRADKAYLDSIPVPAYTASLDATIALVERMLPGWSISITQNVHHGYWTCSLYKYNYGQIISFDARHDAKPTVALLLALFRALQAQETDNG